MMLALLAAALAVTTIRLPSLQLPALLPWTAQHLIGIDTSLPLTIGLSPGQDIVAVYVRSAGNELELRLDLLDLDLSPEADLYLALDTEPGGTQDLPLEARAALELDTLIILPAYGELQILDTDGQPLPGAALRLLRDPEQDTLTLRLGMPKTESPQRLAIEVLATAPGSSTLLDQAGPYTTAAPPPRPLMSMLAFWDVYPAETPATALRRWRGAHTGPHGISHGLGYLLGLAKQHGTPVALIDLQRPAVLSALDYSGGLELVQELNQADLLILPDQPTLTAGQVGTAQLERSKIVRGLLYPPDQWSKSGQAETTFGIDLSLVPCAALVEPETTGSCLQIGSVADSIPVTDIQIQGISFQGPATGVQIPIIDTPGLLDRDGPSLALRQLLVQAATVSQSPNAVALLVLGGSLPQSEWGAPVLAHPTLRYIRSHPWIQLVDAAELNRVVSTLDGARLHPPTNTITATSPFIGARPDLAGESQLPLQTVEATMLQQAVTSAPANALGDFARQTYLDLALRPAAGNAQDPNFEPVWSLIEVAWWAEQPAAAGDCDHDPDRDGLAECILSGENYYLQFEAGSGLLTHFFYRPNTPGRTRVHQIIGPPAGTQAFPEGQDRMSIENLTEITPQISAVGPDQVTFVFPVRGLQITYCWKSDRLQIETTSAQVPLPGINLPLALDPWARFTTGWADRYQAAQVNAYTWIWQLDGEVSISVSAGLSRDGQVPEPDSQAPGLRLTSFLEARSVVRQAENPDQEPPPGFYLPFPLARIHALPMAGTDSFILTLQPSDILSEHPNR